MKTKFCIFIGVIIVAAVTFSFERAAFGQMSSGAYGKTSGSSSTSSSTASGSPASSSGDKPGTILPGGVIVCTPITKEDAMKKYPMAGGRPFPTGDRPFSHTPGHILSPYPPHQEYMCNNVGHGDLVLDTKVNKVFVRP